MGQTPTKITKQWADSPFDLIETPRKRLDITDPSKAHGAINAGTEMALAHKILIRTLNCIYLLAPNVKLDKDIADFIVYMNSWAIAIHEHHANEEELIFPWLKEYIGEKDSLHKNVEKHHAFAPGLQIFADYVNALKGGKETYDSSKIQSIIDSFGPILSEHLKGRDYKLRRPRAVWR